MDHIWQAPSRLKMLLALIFSEQLAQTFGPLFPNTLYVQRYIFKTNILILVDAINCYNCEINEKYNLDTCNAFDDDTPEQNCPGSNFCFTAYGKFNGETDLEVHSCGQDSIGWFKGLSYNSSNNLFV